VEFKVKNAEEDLELSRVDDGEGFNNTREMFCIFQIQTHLSVFGFGMVEM
jgi:hypothetical protein